MVTRNQLTFKKCRKGRTVKKKRIALNFCPQKSGTCISKKETMEPKKPCSARRQIRVVQLSNNFKVICHVPGEKPFQENMKVLLNSRILVRGGRTNDLPGVHYKIIRGAKPNIYEAVAVYERRKGRSRYGAKNLFRFHKIRSSTVHGIVIR